MKNIAFFITHKTLSYEHAELSLKSLSLQDTNCVFDRLYIFNTHEDELPNSSIFELIDKYNINQYFKEIVVFHFNLSDITTLAGIISIIKNYCQQAYSRFDRVLILKSDCLLSKNYFNDLFKLPNDQMHFFVAPFVCAKKRVSNNKILEYIERDRFVRSDDITFFVEDINGRAGTDFETRSGVDVESEQIEFTSCYVITDFSCHFISVGLFDRISLVEQSWGGVKFYNLVEFFRRTDNSFVVHKFHDVVSVNRETDREGPVKQWLAS